VAAPAQFGIAVQNVNGRLVVAVTGELDLAVAGRLDSEIEQLGVAPNGTLVIDLSRLEFMDSSGLRVLVRAHQRSQEQGFRVVLVQGPDPVQRVLTLTGVDEQFEIVPSIEALA
jgi:anti-sigma B factor antagonist